MCMACGCGEMHNNHGDPRHLTFEDLKQAADAAGLSVDEVAQNIQASTRQTRSNPSHGGREPSGPESI
jgi:hypothetical protein